MILLLLLSSLSFSKESSVKEHIEILGEDMDCADDICTVTNKGKDVCARHIKTDGVIKLTAPKMVFSKKASNTLDVTGGVKALYTPYDKTKSPIFVTADRAHYENQIVTAYGNVVIIQDDQVVRGEKAEAHMEKRRIKVMGKAGKPASAHITKKDKE
jgi:lipopolysaccharide export system protein LptA